MPVMLLKPNMWNNDRYDTFLISPWYFFYITLPTGNFSFICTHDLFIRSHFYSITFLSPPQHTKNYFDFMFAFLKFEQQLLVRFAGPWFWSSDMSLTLISHVTKCTHFLRFTNCRYVGHLVNLFVNPFTYSRYTRVSLSSIHWAYHISPSPRQLCNHTKQDFDFSCKAS